MKKRILATLVTLSMVFAMLPTVASAANAYPSVTDLEVTVVDSGELSLQWTYDGALPNDSSYSFDVELSVTGYEDDIFYTSYSTYNDDDGMVSFNLYFPDFDSVSAAKVVIEGDDASAVLGQNYVTCDITYTDTQKSDVLTVNATSEPYVSNGTTYQDFEVEDFYVTKYTMISNNRGSSLGTMYSSSVFDFDDKYYDSSDYWRYGFGCSTTGTFSDINDVGTQITQYTYSTSGSTYTVSREVYTNFYVNMDVTSSGSGGGTADTDTTIPTPTGLEIGTGESFSESGTGSAILMANWTKPMVRWTNEDWTRYTYTTYSATGSILSNSNGSSSYEGTGIVSWNTSNGVAVDSYSIGSVEVALRDDDGNEGDSATIATDITVNQIESETVLILVPGESGTEYTISGLSADQSINFYQVDSDGSSSGLSGWVESDGTFSTTIGDDFAGTFEVYLYETTEPSDGVYVCTITKYAAEIDDGKEDQVLSWDETPTTAATYGDVLSPVTASTTGDGAITYTSSDTDVATVDSTSGAVTIVGAGSATITATAAVTELYRVATATYDITVSPKTITLGVSDATITFGEAVPSDVVITADGLVTGEDVDDLGVTLTAQSANVGTTSYDAALDNANYTVSSVTGTLTITQAAAPTVENLAVGVVYTGEYNVVADTALVLPSDCGTITVNGYYVASDDCAIIYDTRIDGTGLSIDVLAGEIGDTATIETYVSMQNYEDVTVYTVITLEAEPVEDSGSSGGGGGSSSTSSTVSTDGGSVTVTASTSTSGSTVTATVTEATITAALEAADSDEDVTVEITVATKSSTTTLDVNLSSDVLQAMVDSDVTALTISSDLATLELDEDALAALADQAGDDDITISIVEIDAEDVLNAAQQAAVGDAPVYDISVLCNGETITHFDGGILSITLPYTLQDGQSAENIVVWYIDDLGNITPMVTVYDEETETVTFKTTHLSVYAIVHDTNPFADVDPNAYYYDAVLWAVANEITSGTSATTFSPDASCTRAQAVTFLWNAAGQPVVEAANPFTDVSADSYYYNAVLWAVSEGITAGTSDTTFSPDMTCTRDQIVTFLYRTAGQPAVDGDCVFADVSADSYYYDAVLWAVVEGITAGTSDTTFSPSDNCTRGQIVTFLYRNMAE